MFSRGFESFSQLQRNIVSDILSDDEGDKPKKKLAKVHEVPEEDDHQIFSGAKQEKQVFKNIQFGIDMLLDSSDEDETQGYVDDGMIEKDMDNWI